MQSRPNFGNIVKWWQDPQSQSDIDYWQKFFSHSKPRQIQQNVDQQGNVYLTSEVAETKWTGKLQQFCRRTGITPAIVTRVAVYIALFSKGWVQSDSFTGIVRSGRDFIHNRKDFANCSVDATEVIGPCVSVLPSRMPWYDEDYKQDAIDYLNIIELLHKESKSDKESRQHQKVSLSDLVSLSGTDNRAALFDILITYQNFSRQHGEDRKFLYIGTLILYQSLC